MIGSINILNRETAETVLELQRQSYKVEAEYIGTDAIPPLRESLEELIHCGEVFVGFYDNGELAGVISYKIDSNVLDIHRVMVHPKHFRKGIARKLIEYLEVTNGLCQEFIVSTGTKNSPATKLYLDLGFEKIKEQFVEPKIQISHFRKKII